MKISKNSVISIIKIIFIAIIFFFLFRVIRQIKISEIKVILSQLSLSFLIFMISLQVLTQLLIAVQWHRLAKSLGYGGTFLNMIVLNSYGAFYDSITPGAKLGGELRKFFFLKNELSYDNDQSVNLVAIQKAFSFLALLVLAAAAFFYLCTKEGFLPNPIVKLAVFLLISGLLFIVIKLILLPQKEGQDRDEIKKDKIGIIKKLEYGLSNIRKASSLIRQNKFEFAIHLTISFLIWLLYPIKLYLIMNQLTNLSSFIIFPVVFISYFSGMIPITPGGLGTFEGTMTGLFSLLKLDLTLSVTISVIFRFLTFWFVLIMSLLVIACFRLTKIIMQATKNKKMENHNEV